MATIDATLVAIDGIDLGSYAARGLTMTLEPIGGGELAFDINGGLHDLTLEQFRKYRISVSCSDVNAPDLTDVWRGKTVRITCLTGSKTGVYDKTSTDADAPLEINSMVDTWQTSADEWGATTGWRIDFIQR